MSLFSRLLGASNAADISSAVAGGALLIDVRTASEFASGSVPGAVNVPLDILDKRAESLDRNRQIVVFCQSGSRSAMAKRILERLGIRKVLNGGGVQEVAASIAAGK